MEKANKAKTKRVGLLFGYHSAAELTGLIRPLPLSGNERLRVHKTDLLRITLPCQQGLLVAFETHGNRARTVTLAAAADVENGPRMIGFVKRYDKRLDIGFVAGQDGLTYGFREMDIQIDLFENQTVEFTPVTNLRGQHFAKFVTGWEQPAEASRTSERLS